MFHHDFNTWDWILKREMGIKPPFGFRDRLHSNLFSTIMPCNSWDPSETSDHTHHGGIFNLEFAPNGSLLVAACERRSILMFDPLNRKLVKSVDKAHDDCVNCVKFLDSRIFATCSDDHTVALWDIRFLKSKMRSLEGHSNWVKNVEYASNAELLVTSGFDGSIYTWNINKYKEKGVEYQRVFHTNGLMRTKLTPDGSKLILSTTGGYLVLIHDLDLTSLANDWKDFKPNTYRLMQLSNTRISIAFKYNHLFNASRNRVELISDFPQGNDAEVIASLQVHPQGWCVLSRNTSSDENSEWTCVHDIQDPPPNYQTSNKSENNDDPQEDRSSLALAIDQLTNPDAFSENISQNSWNSQLRRGSVPSRPTFEINNTFNHMSSRRFSCTFPDIIQWCSPLFSHQSTGTSSRDYSNSNAISEPSQSSFLDSSSSCDSSDNSSNNLSFSNHTTFVVNDGSTRAERTLIKIDSLKLENNDNLIHSNVPRLIHYIEEPNVGRGFIKELCFSSDGRLICSPFGFGVRLLAFHPKCLELSDCEPEQSLKLYELSMNVCHSSVVVTTKFSPTHCMLVSGCLNGKIAFHQPLL